MNLEDEMKNSYLDYSMSVIVSRALPDVRDGLKPVHRRILFGMNGLNLYHDRAYKKCAGIVGEVMGKYHPHGDSAIYDSLVRMAQNFSMRYPLVDGQGNFGSVDGDSAAAMRYTEARMSKLAGELLKDIEKDTVNFRPNYDDSLEEPTVLPAAVPNLLLNGSDGIAVGMATRIPPHNFNEVISGTIAAIDSLDENGEVTITNEELIQNHVLAPDFPTGGIIYGIAGVREAYLTGRGKITVRAKCKIEQSSRGGGREAIIVTEIPFQVNKTTLIEKIVEIVKLKKVEEIADIRDESDREGMRLVIELKRGTVSPNSVLNTLYKHTQLQTTFGVIMLALVDGRPQVLTLRDVLKHFIDHRHEIIIRRTQFDLNIALKRAHILEGLLKALDHIDEVINTIRSSKSRDEAQTNLMEKFEFSEEQSKAILEMQLQRLTGLEREKLQNEYKVLLETIAYYREILANRALRMKIMRDELSAIREVYGDKRKTEIEMSGDEFTHEDFIAEEDVVVSITHEGFIKRSPVSEFKTQGRGGKGSFGAKTKDEDFVQHLFVASTHSYILFFTNKGRCYWLKVYEIPPTEKNARGRAIVNLVEFQPDEKIAAFLPVREFDDKHFIVMVTRKGTIKKTSLSAYSNVRKGGVIAINIREEDSLVQAALSNGKQDIIIGTHNGMAVRFDEKDARELGRNTSGMRGIRLKEGDYVIGMVVTESEGKTLLVVTDKGYGKRTFITCDPNEPKKEDDNYRKTRRGGKGVRTMKTTEKVGNVLAILEGNDEEDLMIITEAGVVIRLHIKDISTIGRNTQGVRLIKVGEGGKVSDIARVPEQEDAEVVKPETEVLIEETNEPEEPETDDDETNEPEEE
ncbi:DNA gyrase subunit A [bacterium]|nr:DNA gyrase subunit A [bacterium]